VRIGFHAHLLYSGDNYRNAGISQYTRQLLSAMQPYLTGHELTAFVNSGFSEARDFPATRFVSSVSTGDSPLQRILFEQLTLPLLCRRLRIDVLHGLAFALPLALACPGVVTVHDVGFMRYSDKHRGTNRRYLTAISKASARRARRVIAVSHATAEDCVQLLGARKERVRVVHCGVSPDYFPRDEADVTRFRCAHGLDAPFLLCVGTLEPRKNLWNLLQAFNLARQQGLRHRLKVVGGTGWMYEDMLGRAKEQGLDEAVDFVGFAPAAEMPLWYQAADIFIYPSLLEGFGLPVAEAMASGVPVITSNVSSLPEVGGDAAFYVDPTSVENIAAGMISLAADKDRQKEMRAAGLERVKQFSWDIAARKTLEIYEEAVT
jgi:glycosyltransferase involved in cell wall biosynthesis